MGEEEFHIRDGKIEVYTGRDAVVTVPAGIHTIGKGAFKACVSMKKVVLPSGLLRIEAEAFKGCRNLQEAEIPAGVCWIGAYAFHRCHALQKVALPFSVKELGDCVFLYCDSLEEVYIPGVRRLGVQVFVNDVSLRRLEISEELEEDCICDVFTGCGALQEVILADSRGEQACRFPNAVEIVAGDMIVPRLVRTIAVDVLRMMELEGRRLVTFRTNLKHVDIPEGIEAIGKSCFYDKRGILSVRFPESLREIGSRAFRNCINLETVIFEGNNVSIHEDAFRNCSSLKEIRMPQGPCFRLEGIGGFGDREIPKQAELIRKQVLGNLRISGSILRKYLGQESRVAVPEGITVIGEEAFAGNEAVDRVLLPGSLREIGAGAFRDCVLLQTAEFPDGLKRIGAGAFENCVKLLRIKLPESLSKIDVKTFKRCRSLKEISFGQGIRQIGEQAFYGCTAIREAELPESLQDLGEMAFYRCEALKAVTLPAGTAYVGNLAFAQSGVRKVRISGSGQGYGTGIFADCARLRYLYLEDGVCHIPDRLAYGCTALEEVRLPDSIRSVGRNVWEKTAFLENWLRNRQEAESEILWDGRNLEGEHRLSDRVKIVAGGAFYGNRKLTAAEIPAGVRWVGPAAFKGCGGLRQVIWDVGSAREGMAVGTEAGMTGEGVLSENVSEGMAVGTEEGMMGEGGRAELASKEEDGGRESGLEAEIFSGCTLLERVMIRDVQSGRERNGAWQVIGERAFYQCGSLKKINLEGTVEIGKEAFSGCGQMQVCSGIFQGEQQSLLWIGEAAFEGTVLEREALEKSIVQGHTSGGTDTGEEVPIGKSGYEEAVSEGKGDYGLVIVGTIVISGKSCGGELCVQEGITGIAPYAFSGNKEITRIVLPRSLQRIGEGAFWGCSGLLEVEFSETACRIEARAFEKCISLGNVDLRARQLGAGAFAYCISLISARISGRSILPERLFEGCRTLRECICPQVKAVKANCFNGCRQLEAFDFSRVCVVREYAFAGCENLRQAAFPESACIRAHAFEDCSRLEGITLLGPRGEIRLWEYAFSGCTDLTWVNWKGQVWNFDSYEDILKACIPEMVRLIFHSAMSCFEVEKEENLKAYRGAGRRIRIPRGIRRIESEVFRDAMGLEEIEIPDSVEYIGARAFHGTGWIERQKRLSPMVTVNHMILDGSGCSGTVEVPEEISLVCGWAFANGMKIEGIRFLSAGTRVEEYAFRNCIFLREIILPEGTQIEIHGIQDRERELPALAKQAVMESMNCFKTDENGVLAECTGNISRLRLAEGITAIGEGAFQEGNLLTEIILPTTVKRIGKRAFWGCKWLKEVRRAGSVEEIDNMAFFGCGALEAVELSEQVRRIGARAFENCTCLTEILIPEGVEEIPDRTFYRCHSLRTVSFPSSLKRVGKEAFAYCRGLEEFHLPLGVEVGERAFAGVSRSL